MLTPAINSTPTSTTVNFAWTPGIGVDLYWLYVGSSVGSNDLVNANMGTSLSTTVTTGIPIDERPLYVRLYSHIASGNWEYVDYTITAPLAAKAVLTSPTPSSTLTSGAATFTWTAGVGVAQYWLNVGSSVGTFDLVNLNMGTSLSTSVTGLPTDGRTLYVRVYSHLNGTWQYNDYTLTAASLENAETPDAGSAARAPSRVDYTSIVNLLGTGNGTVSSSPSGFNCTGMGATCSAAFAASTTVTLTAAPASGHTFAGWGGACSGMSTTCELTLTEPQTVTATFNGTPTITYYHTDMLGSVRAITDGSGSTVIRHDFMAFGESSSTLTGDLRRYIGGEMDAESAFEYLGARYYKNLWGRFTSVDPIFSAGAATNPQLWNRYAYALNGPLRYIDPDGLEPQDRAPFKLEVTVNVTAEGTTSNTSGWCIYNCGIDAELFYLEGLSYFLQGPRRAMGQRLGRAWTPEEFWNAIGDSGRRTDAVVTPMLATAGAAWALVGGGGFIALEAVGTGGTTISFSRLAWGAREINQIVGTSQRALLRNLVLRGELSPALTEQSMRLYLEVARRQVALGLDNAAVQAGRIAVILEALNRR